MKWLVLLKQIFTKALPFVRHAKTARDVALAADVLDAVIKDDADKKTEQQH